MTNNKFLYKKIKIKPFFIIQLYKLISIINAEFINNILN